MKYNYEAYHSLIVTNKNLTKDVFLKQAGVINGYSAELFSRIYDAIFSEAINVEDLYNTYYSVEYKDIREFLYLKFCINDKELDRIFNVKNECDNNIIIAIDDLSYGKSTIIVFAFSDSMYERMTNILLMKKP